MKDTIVYAHRPRIHSSGWMDATIQSVSPQLQNSTNFFFTEPGVSVLNPLTVAFPFEVSYINFTWLSFSQNDS